MTSPTFLKGVSRVFDLYGKLEEYSYQESADYHATETDWKNVGDDIFTSINQYVKKGQKVQRVS